MDKASSTTNAMVINVTVRDKDKIVFEEEVVAVTSINEKGIFDVLPEHENFISIIKEFVIIHRKNEQKEHIKIERGVLKVKENKIEIYLGI